MSCLPEELPLHTDVHGAALPDAFGPFRVLHQIGVGALGPLFRAYDDQRDRLVAIKVFRLSAPPERLHQLAAEFEALIGKGLSHPGIAAPIAAGTDGIIVYLVREFVAAESLDVVLRTSGAMPAAEALRLFEGLARALDYAADLGVHHGALHPRDVLVGENQVRLTDLGVCQAIEKVGVSAPVRRPYSAPERIASAPWSRRADIFSLAMLMSEMLTGRPSGAPAVDSAVTIPDVAGAEANVWRAAFARALAQDPGARFNSAGEMIDVLQGAFRAPADSATKLLDQFPVEASSRTLQPPSARQADRVRLLSHLTDQARPLPLLGSEELAAKVERSEQRIARTPAPSLKPLPDIRRQVAQPSRPGRSGWSIAAALAIGVAVGFGAGYLTWRPRLSPPALVKSQPPQIASFAPGAPDVAPPPVQSPDVPHSTVPFPPAPPAKPKAQLGGPVGKAEKPPSTTKTEKPATLSRSSVLTGALHVESRPAGADVFLDGKHVGTTPLMMMETTAGQHAIRLELAGYREWSSTARVAGGERTRVTASLEQ